MLTPPSIDFSLLLPPGLDLLSPGPDDPLTFLKDLKATLDDPTTDHYIRWSPDGTQVWITDKEAFVRECSHLCKSRDFRTFKRKFNKYEFKQVNDFRRRNSAPYPILENRFFRRGAPELMSYIQYDMSAKAKRRARQSSRKKQQENEALHQVAQVLQRHPTLSQDVTYLGLRCMYGSSDGSDTTLSPASSPEPIGEFNLDLLGLWGIL